VIEAYHCNIATFVAFRFNFIFEKKKHLSVLAMLLELQFPKFSEINRIVNLTIIFVDFDSFVCVSTFTFVGRRVIWVVRSGLLFMRNIIIPVIEAQSDQKHGR